MIFRISVTTLALVIPRLQDTIVKYTFLVHRRLVTTTELARILKTILITSVLAQKLSLEASVNLTFYVYSWSLVKIMDFARILTICRVSTWKVMIASVRVTTPDSTANTLSRVQSSLVRTTELVQTHLIFLTIPVLVSRSTRASTVKSEFRARGTTTPIQLDLLAKTPVHVSTV